MERFVKLVVAGGITLVAGLWLVALAATGSPVWMLGAGLAGVGTVAVGAGIEAEIEW